MQGARTRRRTRELRLLGPAAEQFAQAQLYQGKGCADCNGTGYRGRMGIFEIFVIDDEVRHMILRARVRARSCARKARELGMRTLREDGLRKVVAGVTTLEEVFRVTMGDDRLMSDRATADDRHERPAATWWSSEGASDLHLAVGRAADPAPARRAAPAGRRRRCSPEDTERLMKSITSEEHQQEVREQGGTDFGFAFGDMARFRVSVFKQKGHVGIVLRLIPTKLLTLEEIGLPPSGQGPAVQAARPGPGHRARPARARPRRWPR